ncbi:MAG: LptF/LptG family permease [Candidatus Omnitrophica bacterium]|nr:LptF/LptG family permease [Candidatus Omnitrophota bacterium]MCF7894567.1 LptF/LptG family permease [Candidatus Omnitrophota bacterium]
MRILDKYILKNIILSYLFILLLFTGLHLLIDIFSSLSDILKNTPPLLIIVKYYTYLLPLIILRVSPLALLMSVLYTYSSFGKNNELITIRTSGISSLKIAYPAIFLAIFISCFVFFLQEKILIQSQSKAQNIKKQYIEKETKESEIRNLAFISQRSIFFIETFLPKEKKMKNIIIFEQNTEGDLLKKTHCKSAKYLDGKWIGYNLIEFTLENTTRLKNAPIVIEESPIFLPKKPEELAFEKSMFIEFTPLVKLGKQINNLEKVTAGKLLKNLKIDFYKKVAFPFSHLFLIIGSLPIALEIRKRKATFAAVGIGLIFSLVYSLTDSISIALGKSGLILPFFSAWLAPLFFLSIGITGLILTR